MRSKANNFIGGLHNLAAIPGVIVFPLRLSCTDESLMHSCLGIMDGTGQLLPSPAAGARSGGEMNGAERESTHGLWTECKEQSEGWAEKRAWRVRRCVKYGRILVGCMDTVCVPCVQAFIAYCTYMG